MNETILIIAALAPGFIGIAADKLLTGDTSKVPLDANIFKYFLYATAALLMTECTPYASPLTKALTQQQLTTKDILLPMAAAAAIGTSWNLWLRELLEKVTNFFLRRFHKNEIELSKSLIFNNLLDGKPHLLEVQLPNGQKHYGRLEEYSIEEHAFFLDQEPEWVNDPNFEKYYKGSIIYLDSGVTIQEYDYKIKE